MSTVINFATGVPRITNKGLLVEEARTNLLNYSQEFDNAYWTKANATISANAVAAPDGTLTADKLAETTFLGAHAVQKTGITVTTATSHVVSIYAKAAERSQIQIQYFDGTTNKFPVFSLIDGSKVTDNGIGSAWSATQLSDGWWRFDIIVTSASTSAGVYFYPAVGGSNSYQGVTGSGIYIWGAQLEAGSFATSYIPTTSASATRAIDVAAVASIPTPSAGHTLFVEFEPIGFGVSNQALVQFDDGTQSNRSFIFIAISGLLTHLCQTGGVTQANDLIGGSAVTVGTVYKAALRVEANNFRGAVNGALGTLDSSGTIPTAPTVFRPGTNSAGATPANSYIKRAQLIPRALSDAELQALTA